MIQRSGERRRQPEGLRYLERRVLQHRRELDRIKGVQASTTRQFKLSMIGLGVALTALIIFFMNFENIEVIRSLF